VVPGWPRVEAGAHAAEGGGTFEEVPMRCWCYLRDGTDAEPLWGWPRVEPCCVVPGWPRVAAGTHAAAGGGTFEKVPMLQ